MKIIVALCLVAFVACESYPAVVHPNANLIEEAKEMMTEVSSRIINGDNAQISNFKWQASLRLNNNHICGAAIVAEGFAITAAHCVDGFNAGDMSLKVGSSSRTTGGTVVQIIAIHKHESYSGSSSGFPNDIAVLETASSLTNDANAEKADLPDANNNYSGEDCQITGWGRTSSTSSLPATLQVANTKVMTQSSCKQSWGNSINNGHVCVYTGSNGACNGDSGGPLTCNSVLVGVTSWGRNGCSVSYPSVYTRISHYLTWINTKIGQKKTVA